MVPPDSCGIPGVPHYLGKHVQRGTVIRLQGYYLLRQNFPESFNFNSSLSLVGQSAAQPKTRPTTPHMQRLSAITHTRFGLIRFRSPLLTESLLFSFPAGTEMFHFPAFPPTTLYIQVEVAGHDSGISRFPYSEIPGSKLVYQLPRAYRRLQRPSSALGA